MRALRGPDLSLPDLYVLRHGETEWNREFRFQGNRDSPLTALGRAQAVAMGQTLRARGVSQASHAVHVSPQGRALDTARLAFPDAPLRPDPRLAEIGMGLWSGLTRAQIDATWPGPPEEPMLSLYARCPGAERYPAVWDRVAAFLADLDRPAIVVSHGMTGRFLRACALGLDWMAAEALPGGQGIIHHLQGGTARVIPAEGLPQAGQGARPPL